MTVLVYWLSSFVYVAVAMISGWSIWTQSGSLNSVAVHCMGFVFLLLCTLASCAALWFTWDCVGFPFLGRNRRLVAST